MNAVVFVDIDGVLNTSKNYAEWRAAHDEARTGVDLWCPSDDDCFVRKLFDPVNVAHLNTLTTLSGAQIVISSSWRMFYRRDSDKLATILRSAGVTGVIAGVTPTIIPERVSAIGHWLAGAQRSALRVAILDDEYHSTFGALSPWHVEIDAQTGFIERDIARALKVMERPWTR